MKHILLIILTINFLSCNTKKTSDLASTTIDHNFNKDSILENMVFNEFISKIPQKRLPIFFSCGISDTIGSENSQVSNFNKYKNFIPIGFDRIFGATGQFEKFEIIIFGQTGDDIYPTLFTYDKKGNIIDSLFLILNPCGGADEYEIPHSYAFIDNDLLITLIDTAKLIHYPDHEKDYIVDSIRISKVNYQVNINGKIIGITVANPL